MGYKKKPNPFSSLKCSRCSNQAQTMIKSIPYCKACYFVIRALLRVGKYKR